MVTKRISELKPSPADVVSYASFKTGGALSGFFGGVRLRVKSALFGVRVGRGVRAYGRVMLLRYPKSRIVIGDGVLLNSSSVRSNYCAIHSPVWLRTNSYDASIEIRKGAGLNGTSIYVRSTSVTIGENTMVAANCVIADSDAHVLWPAEGRLQNPGLENDAPVVIGRDVWLGLNCTVLKGVTIGDGSVIAAGSVVTSDIPAGVLAAGVPARVIRELG